MALSDAGALDAAEEVAGDTTAELKSVSLHEGQLAVETQADSCAAADPGMVETAAGVELAPSDLNGVSGTQDSPA